MAAGPVWQSNYVDLCDDRTARFGAECVVCGARYATAPEPLVAAVPANREPDPMAARQIEEQKYRLFSEFDQAFRSITITCYRCGRPACPDCWDVDKQMCGACVAERGLVRSPHRGGPVEGPLADGFLRRLEPGRYSEVGRPTWLKELLRAQSDPDAVRAASVTAPPVAARSEAQPANGAAAVTVPTGDPDGSYPALSGLSFSAPSFEPPPTAKMATNGSPAGPPGLRVGSPGDSLSGPEGEATAGMVACPRCGAANYDFVTQCTECGLQLIQICPSCERLNPGHAAACQYCGSPLRRPRGWSGVLGPITPLAPEEARRRMTDRPMTGRPVTPGPQVRQPASWDIVDDAPPAEWHGGRQRHSERAEALPDLMPGPLYAANPAPAQRPYESASPAGARHPYESAGPAPVTTPRPYESASPVGARHPYESAGPAPVTTPRPYESAGPALETTSHPYDTGSHALQPIMAADPHALPGPGHRYTLAMLGLVIERLLTLAVVLVFCAAIAAIVAAETSTRANQSLSAIIHIDIRKHVELIITWLRQRLQNQK
jgi:hypothetical protein